MALSIEPFTEADMETLVPVLRAAYKAERDYRSIVRLHVAVQPECSLVAKLDGRVVGFGAAAIYGPFSYVGLMATDPAVQRHGVAGRVLSELISTVETRGCTTLLLDASAAGQHLYEDAGFVTVDRTVVYRREPGSSITSDPHLDPSTEFDVPRLVDFDSPIFGANRTQLLLHLKYALPGRFIVSRDREGRINGYLVAQGQTIGPWVASDKEVSEKLLSHALRTYSFESGPEVFTSASNLDALKILDALGLREQRRLSHMYRGKTIQRERATRIYGQTSLGLG